MRSQIWTVADLFICSFSNCLDVKSVPISDYWQCMFFILLDWWSLWDDEACRVPYMSSVGHFSEFENSLSLAHLVDWMQGIKDDLATIFLHSSLSSAFWRASPNLNPVHSGILSSHLFRIIFASPVDLVMCAYHLNFSQWW